MFKASRRSAWLWRFSLLAVWFILVASPFAEVQARSATALSLAATPKMTARAGFDSYYKQYSWLPVQINLVLGEGSPNFEGWVEASWANFASDATRYRHKVELIAPVNRTVWLYLPTPQRQYTEVQVRLSRADESPVETLGLPVKSLSRDEFLIGVVSDDGSALNYLNGERLSQPFNLANGLLVSGYSNRSRTANSKLPTTRIAHLAPTDLPPDGAGWDGLDGLALTDLTAASLGDQSLNQTALSQAAASWLAGGRFLFGAGDGALRRGGPLTNLLPVKTVAPPITRGFPAGLNRYVRNDPPPARLLLAQTSLAPGASAESTSDDGRPVLARRPFGLGTSWFLAGDLRSLPASINFQIWSNALNDYEPRLTYAAAHRQPYDNTRRWASEISPNTKIATILDARLLIFIFVVYVLLVGPVTYLVMRRLDRPELTWLAIPVVAVTVSLLFFLSGVLSSGDNLVLSRTTIVTTGETTEGKLLGGTTNLASIYSNNRVDFQLLASENTQTLPLNYVRNSSYYYNPNSANQPPDPAITVQQGAGGGYGQVTMGLNDQRNFLAEDSTVSGIGEGIVANVRATGDELEGTLENRTGKDWIDLTLWKPGGMLYNIRQIKAGEKISLARNLAERKTGDLIYAITGVYAGGYSYASGSEYSIYNSQKNSTLLSLLGSDGDALPRGTDRVYLIAWRQATQDFPLRIDNRSLTPVDLTLLFEPMALK